jgi:hypothetical protein
MRAYPMKTAECPAGFRRVTATTAAYQTEQALVGGSPYNGDMGGFGIILPAEATSAQNRRLLVQLAAVKVGYGSIGIVRLARQYISMATEVEVGQEGTARTHILERPITDAAWHLPGGNVTWHLMFHTKKASRTPQVFNDIPWPGPPYRERGDGVDCAILARNTPVAVGGGGYVPLGGGLPPGEGIGDCSMMRDLRWPWHNYSEDLGYYVQGQGIIALWASIHQPDTEEAIEMPPLPDCSCGILPEDQFLISYPQSRYYRIAGSLTVDLCTGVQDDDC